METAVCGVGLPIRRVKLATPSLIKAQRQPCQRWEAGEMLDDPRCDHTSGCGRWERPEEVGDVAVVVVPEDEIFQAVVLGEMAGPGLVMSACF